MKHPFILLWLLISLNCVHAQLFTKERVMNNENFDKPRLSWGYYLGFNSYDFNIDYFNDQEDIQNLTSTGFNVGLLGNLRINDYIDLRIEPGLVISNRVLNYDTSYFSGLDFEDKDLRRDIKSTYIHVPLLVKFSTLRVNNIKPFILAGVSAGINLSSDENNPDDNSKGVFRLTKNNFFYELGIGIDIYLTWFKFTPSLRGIFSINDELIRDFDPNSPWTKNIDQIQTRGMFINFTFQ